MLLNKDLLDQAHPVIMIKFGKLLLYQTPALSFQATL